MNARRVEVTFSEKDWVRLERARGHEPRASFVRRALEQKLDLMLEPCVVYPGSGALESALGGAEEPVHEVSGRAASAPARASEPEDVDEPILHREPMFVRTGRDLLNAQRQERLNKGKKL